MLALSWSPPGMLRCPVSLRGFFVWLLLALLLAGAASYTHGSRYALIPGHSPFQSAGVQALDAVPPQAGNRFQPCRDFSIRGAASASSTWPARPLSLRSWRRTAANAARPPAANPPR